MFAPPAPSSEFPAAVRAPLVASQHSGPSPSNTLSVQRVGHLVPAIDFDGIVHSAFARACNIAREDTLLTIVADELADGPTILRLARGGPPDLRLFFRPGDRFRHRQGVASTRAVSLRIEGALIWRPAPAPAAASRAQLASNLRFATRALERHRRTCSSVIDRHASALLGALGEACRHLDIGRATAGIDRLVGWGEGLTPAGDDVIVGLLGSLTAGTRRRADRIAFLRSLSEAVIARAPRTTAISAHYLRLAAQGHFNADVTRLRDALLGDDGAAGIAEALHAALDVGATSGADMVTGMIAGFAAWSAADGEPGHAPAPNSTESERVPG